MLQSHTPFAAPEGEQLPPPEAKLGRQTRRSLQIVGVLILGLFLLAAVIPIGGAVIGQGKVGLAGKVKRVTHPTGGVIAAIFVRNGSKVRAGQPLLQFDNGVSGSQSHFAAATVSQLLAQKARLEAEQLGLPAIRFPEELTRSSSPDAAQAVADQARLFRLRQDEQAGLRAQLATRTVQMRREIAGYNAQIVALQQQSALIEPERQGVRELWKDGLVTINRKNELERTAVDLTGRIGSLRASIARTEAQISEVGEQSIQLGQTRRSEAGAELAQVNNALNEQRSRSVVATDAQDRSLVKAAYAGVVDKLAFFAVGDVVRPAEPIMEIVPENDELIVEASISPNDVEQVAAGQSARIRFSSLNSTATPEVLGKVVFVAPEQTVSEDGRSAWFAVRVEMSRSSLRQSGVAIRTGIPAEVYIETGSRTMLSYVTKPLRDQLARAFRDN